jgi:hypothetical protein
VEHTKHPSVADLKPRRLRWPTFAVATLFILESKMSDFQVLATAAVVAVIFAVKVWILTKI